MMDHQAINKARTVYYGLFASAFAFHFSEEEYRVLMKAVDTLSIAPADDLTAETLQDMKTFMAEKGFDGLKDESDQVFFSPSTTFVPMTASFYYEKRDDGSQRLEMIEYVLQSGFRRNEENFKENEDHLEFMLIFIQQLLMDELDGNAKAAELSKKVFANILNGIIDTIAENVYLHEKSVFYKHVAILLSSFVEIERQLLDISRPMDQEVKDLTRAGLRKGKLPPRQMQNRNLDEFESI